jgi:hypothetical protein
MYCPNCGNSVPNDLKYCNGCGKRLGIDDADDSPAQMLRRVLNALFLIVIFGLGILVGLVAVLLGSGVKSDGVIFVAATYLATLFGIAFSLVRQVPKLIDAKLGSNDRSPEYAAPAQLKPRTTAQLEDYREPVMSVTDHTTRILEKDPLRNP